jgi:hypothetical protein
MNAAARRNVRVARIDWTLVSTLLICVAIALTSLYGIYKIIVP